MTDERRSTMDPMSGRVLGWLSGLGIVVVPWLAAGVVSTFTPEPEASFPWVFAVVFAVMVGWIVYGSVRIPAFGKGALLGSALAVGIVVFVGFLLWRSHV